MHPFGLCNTKRLIDKECVLDQYSDGRGGRRRREKKETKKLVLGNPKLIAAISVVAEYLPEMHCVTAKKPWKCPLL